MPRTVTEQLRFEPEPTKGSRFITTLGPVSNEAEARTLVETVRQDMPDASHHCAAWRIAAPNIERALDDGEPSGSAGRPILAILTGRDLIDISVVVTRYFGGTKLGVGGLVRAYAGAAAAALDRATFVERISTVHLVLECGYPQASAAQRVLIKYAVGPGDVGYTDVVVIRVEVPVDRRADLERSLRDATSGQILIRGD